KGAHEYRAPTTGGASRGRADAGIPGGWTAVHEITVSVAGIRQLAQILVDARRNVGKLFLAGVGVESVEHAVIRAHIEHLFAGLLAREKLQVQLAAAVA